MYGAGKFPDVYKQNKKISGREFYGNKSTFLLNGNDFLTYNGNGKWQIFDLEKYGIRSRILSFLTDDRYLWIATEEQGIFKIDVETSTIAANILQNELVIKILKDQEKNLWFITYNNGAFVLKSNAQLFTNINSQITFSTCNLKFHARHYLFIGNNNGLIYQFCDGKQQGCFQLSTRKFNRVLDIIPAGTGRVLIGCDGGLYQYNLASNTKTDLTAHLSSYKNYAIAPDSSIWCCSHDHILILKNNQFTALVNKSRLLKYTAIAVVADSCYYVGTTNKLFKVSDGTQLSVILDDHVLKTQVTSLKIVDGYLWVATHGNGVFIVKNDKIVEHINKINNGVVSDICEKLYDDGEKYVWLATNEGLSAFGRTDHKLIGNVNSDAGIISNDIKNISSWNGSVYAATAAGTSIFDFQETQLRSDPPGVYVTRYKIGNATIIDPGGTVNFDYFKGFITISFTAITFQSSGSLQYEYKFAEDAEWHRTPVTDIPFFALRPGTHTLMFRAKKYNSSWSTPTTLSIIVNPAWYQTFAFKVLCAILLTLAMYCLVVFRLRAFRKKEREEHEHNRKINELENKALISQMNPHFIFNSLNTVQQLILVKEEEQSLNYLSDFSMLMRKMLENSRRQLITLAEELEFLECYLQLEVIRFSNKFAYSISIDSQLVQDEIKIPPVLLQPLLENAIKHGVSSVKDHAYIKLSVARAHDFLMITVEDNGIGIQAHKAAFRPGDKKNGSTALIVLEERLKLIKNDKGEGSLMNIIDKGYQTPAMSGTLIELRIPILT
jgi:hypothetical protein